LFRETDLLKRQSHVVSQNREAPNWPTEKRAELSLMRQHPSLRRIRGVFTANYNSFREHTRSAKALTIACTFLILSSASRD